MKISINKTETTATIIMAILMTSAFMLIPIIPVGAQPSSEQPVSGPLPPGATPSATVPTVSWLSTRPNPVGLDQVFLVNL